MEILSIIVWPVAFLIAFIIFVAVFYNHIKERIQKLNAIGKSGARFSPTQSISKDDSPIDKLTKDGSSTTIDKALNLFSIETIKLVDIQVKKESGIESIDTPENREKTLLNYSKIIYLIAEFRTLYSTIYGSQLKILQKLNSSNSETKESLKVYYEEARSTSPNSYKKYPYDQYLEFLTINNLIEITPDGKITIKSIGRDLLMYIHQSQFPFDKIL